MTQSKFPDGIFFNKPREGAPEFVRGSISIKVDQALPFLEKNKNAQGYVNLDMLLSKSNSIYLQLNEWKNPESLNVQPQAPQPLRERPQTQEGFNSDGSPVPNFNVINNDDFYNSI